ncbi:Hemagglutinin-related protein [Granulibacter bethesdensis]|uniref:Hemagglutinin-related protein n=1 Tax=Granulibacter bethesdensis TaxID=364410 RepID=A0AAC9P8N2_9PROT|nr:Hint domain-containing protein [Granulibacter bethesdensis]APH54708.1 Hemagglutinin-related protein [Granulibacter bethesdensis]APH62295.1 Hemagglutinin-related protein [Granulibacter bethesdensis]
MSTLSSTTSGVILTNAYANPIDINPGVTVSNTSGVGIGSSLTTPWTINNSGAVSGTTTGISLASGGTITNLSGASIAGGNGSTLYWGIQIGSQGTVNNSGSISGAGGIYAGNSSSITNNAGGVIRGLDVNFGITVNGNGNVVNAGGITAATDAVNFGGDNNFLNNSGSLVSNNTGNSGAYLNGVGNYATNTGFIKGGNFGLGMYSGTIVNAGSINATNSSGARGATIFSTDSRNSLNNTGNITSADTAVYMGGGTITNSGTDAHISGASIGVLFTVSDTGAVFGNGTITNSGTVVGGSVGISSAGSLIVTNLAGGYISGSLRAIGGSGGASIDNSGTIVGANGISISGASVNITNRAGGTIQATGTRYGINVFGTVSNIISNDGNITAIYDGLHTNGIGSVTNTGIIISTGSNFAGVYLSGNTANYASNSSTGRITGAWAGLGIDTGTVVNDGTIIGNSTAADGRGVIFQSASSGNVLTNTGQITSTATGVLMAAGTINNTGTAATIVGNTFGVVFSSGSLAQSIVNSSKIQGGVFGISAAGNANVSNQVGGYISGGSTGIVSVLAGTVANYGTIIGSSGPAIALQGTGSNLLQLGVSSQITGSVTANSAGTNTLELLSGASAGTISGIGTQYVGFQTATVDSGATWTINGGGSFTSFTNSGNLTNTGTLSVTNGVVIAGAGVLTNSTGASIASTGTQYVVWSTGTGATFINVGTVSATNAVSLSGNAVITNNAGGLIQATGTNFGITSNGSGNIVSNSGNIRAINDAVNLGGSNNFLYNSGSIVSSQSTNSGVYLNGTQAYATNSAAGFIQGGVFGFGAFSGTINNSGSINATNTQFGMGIGIYTVDNFNALNNTGRITSGSTGVNMGGGIVNNTAATAYIGGSYAGIIFGGNTNSTTGQVTLVGNGSVNNTGTIFGGNIGITSVGSISVTNSGKISGASQGIMAAGAIFVTNQAGASIVSNNNAIRGSTGTISNFGTIQGNGVTLFSGGAGFVTNSSGALIESNNGWAVQIDYGSNTVNNAGKITGANDGVHLGANNATAAANNTLINTGSIISTGVANAAAYLEGSGNTASNSGYIQGGAYGIGMDGGGINNAGTITVSNGLGVLIRSVTATNSLVNTGTILSVGTGAQLGAGSVQNNGTAATISGAAYGILFTGSSIVTSGVTNIVTGTVTNSGSILSGNYGISAAGAVLVTNLSTGLISSAGSYGIQSALSATVVNSGTIQANNYGISAVGSLIVTNQSGGTISGSSRAIFGSAGASIYNAGLIDGGGISLTSGNGTFTNAASATVQATIAGSDHAVKFDGAGNTVRNDGTIVGISDAVNLASTLGASAIGNNTLINTGLLKTTGTYTSGAFLHGTGNYISNAAGGIVIGGGWGLGMDSGTIDNAGQISVSLSSTGKGLAVFGTAGVINNTGTVSSNSTAVVMGGGTLNNTAATAVISGNSYGIQFISSSASGVVLNRGNIQGGVFGISVAGNAIITNQAGGYISGGSTGIVSSLPGTIVNNGTIIGSSGTAIALQGSGANLVQLGVSSQITGSVTANSAGVNILELLSGASTGVVSGIGSQYIGFQTVTIDSGASWAINGSNSIAQSTSLINSGTISIASNLTIAGTMRNTSTAQLAGNVSLVSNGTITNAGTINGQINGGGTSAVLLNTGSVLQTGAIAVNLGSGGTVTNSGLISNAGGTAVYLGGTGTNILNVNNSLGIVGSIIATGNINSLNISGGQGGTLSTLSGLGTTIVGFNQINVATGANWNLTGSNSISSNATFTANSATLTNTGTLAGKVNLGFASTLTNTGILNPDGAGNVISMDASNNRLILVPTAVLNGTVTAQGILNYLELASGSTTGTISSIGTQYVGLNAQINQNANWVMSGSNTFASGLTLNVMGTLINRSTLQSLGTIIDSGLIINSAAIYGGISFVGNGAITNAISSAIINSNGAAISGQASSVSNAGTLIGHRSGTTAGYGISFQAGGTIINTGGVTGDDAGIIIGGAAGTVTNVGAINGVSSYGIALLNGGYISNVSGAVLSGGQIGIYATGAAATIVNDGAASILGNSTSGVAVNLQSGGTITNAGSIGGAGGTAAIWGGSGQNLLQLYAGAQFTGLVIGGATATNTLSLLSSSTSGVISGIGTSFINFQNITVASGASWSLSGSNSIAASYNLINSGLLINAGTFNNSGTISNTAIGTLSGGVTLSNNGLLINSGLVSGTVVGAGSNNTITNYGNITPAGSTAIAMGGTGINLLQLGVSSQINGIATANNAGTNTLELFSGASAGTINGSNFIGFQTGSVDAGAVWTISGNGNFTSLVNNGTLINQGTLSAAQGIILNVSTASLTNANSATISNIGTAQYVISASNSGGIINNSGTISATGSGGTVGAITLLSYGTITNNASAQIVSSGSAYTVFINGTNNYVQNAGLIKGGSDAVNLGANSTLINTGTLQTTGSFTSGAYLHGNGNSISNTGLVLGGGFGLGMDAGTINNAGTISAGNSSVGRGAVFSFASAGNLLINTGAISSNSTAVLMGAGTVQNTVVSALISGAAYGILFTSSAAAGSVLNTGTILGGTYGISAAGSLSVTNQLSAYISGSIGILAQQAATINSNGTIIGSSGTAIAMNGNGANLLQLGVAAQISGVATANTAGSNTLELLSGSSAGTISGSQIAGFQTGLVDANATWTMSGNNSTFTSFTNNGNLNNKGTLAAANGIIIAGTGVIQNAISSVITNTGSQYAAIQSTGTGATVINSGNINAYKAISLSGNARITNNAGGVIQSSVSAGGTFGITAAGGGNVLVNSGNIIAVTDGANLGDSTGGNTLQNSGSITSTGSTFSGVYLNGTGNQATNNAGGFIQAGNFGIGMYSGTVVNAGSINAISTVSGMGVNIASTDNSNLLINTGRITSGNSAVWMGGGNVTNNTSGAVISGSNVGIAFVSATGTGAVSNSGTIQGGNIGISAAGSLIVTNLASATISGSIQAITAAAGANINNSGLIDGLGVFIDNGGVNIVNNSGGIIQAGGTNWAIILKGTTNVVTNAGKLSGYSDALHTYNLGTIYNSGNIISTSTSNAGAFLDTSGAANYVSNSAGGLIQGGWAGLGMNTGTIINVGTLIATNGSDGKGATFQDVNASNLLTNSGRISSASTGVVMGAGSIQNNGASANIIGSTFGIQFTGTTLVQSVLNSGGTIQGGVFGITAAGNANVTNLAGGYISGGSIGIVSALAGTVSNNGTIIGAAGTVAGTAIALQGSGANLLKLGVSSQITGSVTANSAGTNTLELLSGASTGTISGISTQYVGFQTAIVDSGATWAFTGSNSIASSAVLTNSGTINNKGTLAGIITMTSGAALTNAAGANIGNGTLSPAIVSAGTSVNIVNNGTISGGQSQNALIALGASSALTNNGLIQGSGVSANVINAGLNASITNNGSIIETQTSNTAIQIASGTLNNTGLVRSDFAFSNGISASGVATVLNTGTISAAGAFGQAIVLAAGGTVMNSGSIAAQVVAGVTRTAINFGAGNSRLGITSGSSITGNVVANGSGNVLELDGAGTTLSGFGTQYTGFQTINVKGNGWVLSDTLTNTNILMQTTGTLTVSQTLDASNTITLGGTSSAGVGSGNIIISNPGTALAAAVSDFGNGESITLTGLAYQASDVVDVVSSGGNASLILSHVASDGTKTQYYSIKLDPNAHDQNYKMRQASGGNGVTVYDDGTPCYVHGTLILTDRGEVPVEDLEIGDHVITASGEARPIRWLGRRSYNGRFIQGRKDVLPVRIRQGALDGVLPKRDLLVSPLHAMFIYGLLVPAGRLVNGVSIIQEQNVDTLNYVHIELDTHDIVIAEGAASETYVEDNNRNMFHNAHTYVAKPAAKVKARSRKRDGVEGALYCAPRVVDGMALETIRMWLMENEAYQDMQPIILSA